MARGPAVPGARRTLPTGAAPVFALAVAVPVGDYALGASLGHPLPVLPLFTAVGYAVWRSRALRAARPGMA
ncbi:hypothetical protein [Microbispora sp. NPDC049125]|uniref:hypothetical protein n=1 Tax=Microbispora sp. NPDC049125 TaxID=3154929 RepID=UPI00346524E4